MNVPRRSLDTRGNNFGRSLVNLCCVFDVHFLNGRFVDDYEGHVTCFANDGASLVDFMIASSKLFSFVNTFKDLERDDSDHFPISCSIRLEKKAYNNSVISTHDMTTPVTKFKWTSFGQSAFVDNFYSLMSEMYEPILDRIISDINGAADMITKFYQQA